MTLTYFQKILLSVVLALLTSLLFPSFSQLIIPIGTLFTRLLLLISIPIVLFSVMTGIFKLKELKKLRSLGKKILFYSITTTGLAIILGYIVGHLIPLLPNLDIMAQSVPTLPYEHTPSLTNIIIDIIPINILNALAQGNILSVVFLSTLIGSACLSVQKQGTAFTQIIMSFDTVLFKITTWIMQITPFGLYVLLTPKFSDLTLIDLLALRNYLCAVLLALCFHACIILPCIVFFFGQSSPWLLFKQSLLSLATGFSTSSSMATLPITMDQLINKSQVSKSVTSIFISLGTTINMNGTALYQMIAVIFSTQLFNIQLSLETTLLIFIITLIVSMGTAAIPGGGIMTLIIILHMAKIPIDAIGYILLVDQLLDQCRTTVNIWGNICGTKIVSKEY